MHQNKRCKRGAASQTPRFSGAGFPIETSKIDISGGPRARAAATRTNSPGRRNVAGHARPPVVSGAVGPCCPPVHLAGGEPSGMDPHDDIVLGGVG